MYERFEFGTLADKATIEEVPLEERMIHSSVYGMLSKTAERFPSRNAITFQIKSGPKDKAETLNWSDLRAKVAQTANLFRSLGVGEDDVVAYLLPNANETAITLLAGCTAGIVNPINPLLEPEQIAALLNETGAKVLVTLAGFPKTDVNEKAHKAVAMAPSVKTVLELDLKRYLGPPLSWIVPLIRPKADKAPNVQVMDFNTAIAGQPTELTFEETAEDRVGAYFHTGGTTGMPKIAQHMHSGMIYNGIAPALSLIDEKSVLLCPLPLFHVMAAYPMLMSCVATGGHIVMPTPAGYRGDGVFDNFWKLVERWGVTFMVTVPTAAAALMQRPVDANVSTLQYAFCGSAPLPVELFKQFQDATGVKILEGYGMTEATCIVSVNPPHGERKIGSVGYPFPYIDVKILECDADGNILKECAVDEAGEICVGGLAVFPGYTDENRNKGLFAGPDRYLRTGDLGRLDADGTLWITGRAKDLIIRGGHNIDPAIIEESLAGHKDVAFVGAIGQPDAHSGEVPCAYVELIDGGTATSADLMAYADTEISERAAVPKYVEVLDELPKTAVGKVFKPDLRKSAIIRIYGAAFADAGIKASIDVIEDKKLGLVAHITSDAADDAITDAIGAFPRPWQRA